MKMTAKDLEVKLESNEIKIKKKKKRKRTNLGTDKSTVFYTIDFSISLSI